MRKGEKVHPSTNVPGETLTCKTREIVFFSPFRFWCLSGALSLTLKANRCVYFVKVFVPIFFVDKALTQLLSFIFIVFVSLEFKSILRANSCF